MIALLAAAGWWVALSSDDDEATRIAGEAFATQYRVTYFGSAGSEAVKQAIDDELQRIDAMASTWRSDSELMRYNRADKPEAFDLSAELSALLQQGEAIERDTDRAFSLRPDGREIDLSAIAKGYAVDRVVQRLEDEFAITRCMVDIGGEIYVRGAGPSGPTWRVGVFTPVSTSDASPITLGLRDAAVATSGTSFKGDHLIDPATGQPAKNDLVSATVVHADATTADALATAMFVMGVERGLAWAKRHGVRVIFLLDDGTRREHDPKPAAERKPAR
jgi:thiamine biosynthesis lipoprotein